jgi:hypothetical protein
MRQRSQNLEMKKRYDLDPQKSIKTDQRWISNQKMIGRLLSIATMLHVLMNIPSLFFHHNFQLRAQIGENK